MPHPNCITFTKLGYPMFSHIQLYFVLSLTKKYSAIHVKIFSKDFAIRSFVG